jgi:SPP1 gp7 family putative phage head morphogenesis protein
LASSFRARARKRQRASSRTERLKRSPKPPRAAEFLYAAAVTADVKRFAAIVRSVLTESWLERIARPEPETRTDASDDRGDVIDAAFRRLNSRLDDMPRGAVSGALGNVGKRATEHSKREFIRIGIGRLRDKEPALGRFIDQWRRENINKLWDLKANELKRLEKILRDGEGSSVKTLAKQIEERLGVTESKAVSLARDQTGTLNSQITHHRMGAAGITEAIWTTAGDERVRESHQDMDGERYSLDEPPEVDGHKSFPGEPPHCRCVATPVLPELE